MVDQDWQVLGWDGDYWCSGDGGRQWWDGRCRRLASAQLEDLPSRETGDGKNLVSLEKQLREYSYIW